MEEVILELRVNAAARSPDSDRTDAVGSLDHASPLSISLASSEGLSEIRNLALVAQGGSNLNSGTHQHDSLMDSNLPTPMGGVPPPLPLDARPPLPPDEFPGPSKRL